MSERELAVYKFIISHIQEYGYAPTVREIASAMSISLSTALYCLSDLENDGWIKVKPATPRAIKVMGYKFVKE